MVLAPLFMCIGNLGRMVVKGFITLIITYNLTLILTTVLYNYTQCNYIEHTAYKYGVHIMFCTAIIFFKPLLYSRKDNNLVFTCHECYLVPYHNQN